VIHNLSAFCDRDTNPKGRDKRNRLQAISFGSVHWWPGQTSRLSAEAVRPKENAKERVRHRP